MPNAVRRTRSLGPLCVGPDEFGTHIRATAHIATRRLCCSRYKPSLVQAKAPAASPVRSRRAGWRFLKRSGEAFLVGIEVGENAVGVADGC
jgi:hypothetical protein